MEKKLQTNQKYSAHLRSIIATMKQQLAQKDEEIANLRKLVDDKNVDIARLKENVQNLQQRNEMQAGLIASQAETIMSKESTLNTVYIKIGTKKELKNAGLLDAALPQAHGQVVQQIVATGLRTRGGYLCLRENPFQTLDGQATHILHGICSRHDDIHALTILPRLWTFVTRYRVWHCLRTWNSSVSITTSGL